MLLNLAPDEPFGGGVPGIDFAPADPASTGVVMQFRIGAAASVDISVPPDTLSLPALPPLRKHRVVGRRRSRDGG